MRFTPEVVEKIKALRREGCTWDAIANEMGCSRRVVYNFFHPPPPPALSQVQRQEIMELRRQGLTWGIIADRYGLPEEVIRDRIRRKKETKKEKVERKQVQKEYKEKFKNGATSNPLRKKPPHVVGYSRPSPEMLIERERRYARINAQLPTDRLMGDPPLAYSALAQLSKEQKGKLK